MQLAFYDLLSGLLEWNDGVDCWSGMTVWTTEVEWRAEWSNGMDC